MVTKKKKKKKINRPQTQLKLIYFGKILFRAHNNNKTKSDTAETIPPGKFFPGVKTKYYPHPKMELFVKFVKDFFFFFFYEMGTQIEHNVPFLDSASLKKRKRQAMKIIKQICKMPKKGRKKKRKKKCQNRRVIHNSHPRRSILT